MQRKIESLVEASATAELKDVQVQSFDLPLHDLDFASLGQIRAKICSATIRVGRGYGCSADSYARKGKVRGQNVSLAT